MKITRISRIKNHRIFRNYSWPHDLHDFAHFNLIYGWNGSGKTTLSKLLRAVEKRKMVTEGEFELIVDGNSCSGATFDTNQALPRVRVFNRDYVEASVFKSGEGGMVDPIFVLGEDSVEKQKEIERLRKELEKVREKLAAAQQVKQSTERSLDTFRADKALIIKNLLGNDPNSRYRNYHKGNFTTKVDELAADATSASKLLSDAEKQTLILRQQEQPKNQVTSVALSLNDLSILKTTAETLLSTTVVAQTIERLISHPEIATWVESGLHLHSPGTADCEFCGQKLPATRLVELEGHFNDQLKAHTAALDAVLLQIADDEAALDDLNLPVAAELYADLASEYATSEKALNDAVAAQRAALSQIGSLVREKRLKPFEKVDSAKLRDLAASSAVDTAMVGINAVITKHNKETDDFTTRIENARRALEEHCVVEVLGDYKNRKQAVADVSIEVDNHTASIATINQSIDTLDREISQHVRPAEELNKELSSYLGRNELVFKVDGHGYIITRHGLPADHLSEGEKTAIAFLHFLKALESNAGDNAFDLKKDIVVIDDPVSSLDANALFCAYAFLQERTKEAGQLFVLTHNFTFFSLVRKWFAFEGKNERKYFMLECKGTADGRSAAIVSLDPSLERFHSEYHFLFSRVYDEAQKAATPGELVDLYAMPNITRRLLETFLLFRRPGLGLSKNPDREGVRLDEKIRAVAPGFDSMKKARILRFVHHFSHNNKVAEEEHDLFLLGEARDVLRDVLDLVQAEDSEHYRGMLEAIEIAPAGGGAASTVTPIAIGAY